MIHRFCRTPTLVACVLIASTWVGGCATTTGDGHNRGKDEASGAYTRLGMAYLQRNDLERAQQALYHALDLSANDPDALQGLALLYQRQGEQDAAERYFRRALAADGEATRIRNNYAAFLYERGDIARACHQLEVATRDLRYDKRAQLYANLGQCRQQLGQLEQALAAWQRAQAIDPGLTRSYLTIARLALQLDDRTTASRQLARYEQMAGPDEQTRRLAQELSSGRDAAESNVHPAPPTTRPGGAAINAPATQ
ncbi:type IV pilus biogenesis/stability protein PilW [Kushneria phosphatilytica]|uniref:type IV pilus biogenesis/stability protein PilW n=1 Tax=Kushneria phosphatilytica TaxID=657387 RepID=UPI0008D935A5|nr:type IV pilus biogenesis/stability protein PilW [Kushneria phosphatilytica]OHV07784.1 type IV pilus biogenesis/stability protein PilW [Kushneria phosphatilytica]